MWGAKKGFQKRHKPITVLVKEEEEHAVLALNVALWNKRRRNGDPWRLSLKKNDNSLDLKTELRSRKNLPGREKSTLSHAGYRKEEGGAFSTPKGGEKRRGAGRVGSESTGSPDTKILDFFY